MNDWLRELIVATFLAEGPDALMRNQPLLHLAAQYGLLGTVLWLLEQGVDVQKTDHRGRTALFFAANRRMVRVLLLAGADIEHMDLARHKPLHAAVARGKLSAAKALAKAGADLHAVDRRGMTPLHAAAMKGRVKCVMHLIGMGANPNAQDRHRRHPLFYAVAGGHLGAAQNLIELGADLDMLDNEGTSWLMLARMDQVGALQSFSMAALAAEEANDWVPGGSTPRVNLPTLGDAMEDSEAFSQWME